MGYRCQKRRLADACLTAKKYGHAVVLNTAQTLREGIQLKFAAN
jgi:hypothetical protein